MMQDLVQNPKTFSRPSNPDRRGFSLLEVILALGLTAMVMALVGTAVNSTLRTVESGRRRTEREQLARAVMHRIADDLRAVVRYEPFDDSGLNSGIGGGAAAGASSALGAGSTASGGGATDTSSQSSSSQSGEQTETGAEETVTTPVAGIYGYENWVQLDITRIPRLDEYLYADGVNAPLQRGDVRTVTYSLGSAQGNIAGGEVAVAAVQNSSGIDATSGLVRSEVDRAVSLWQTQAAGTQGEQTTAVLAPEVALLEFRYFDGSTWQTQWDSTAMNGIPRAVEISICFYDDVAGNQQSAAGIESANATGLTMNNPDNFYRMVVHLPAGIPLPATPPLTTEEGTDQSSDTSSNASGDMGGSGGTPQTGGPQ